MSSFDIGQHTSDGGGGGTVTMTTIEEIQPIDQSPPPPADSPRARSSVSPFLTSSNQTISSRRRTAEPSSVTGMQARVIQHAKRHSKDDATLRLAAAGLPAFTSSSPSTNFPFSASSATTSNGLPLSNPSTSAFDSNITPASLRARRQVKVQINGNGTSSASPTASVTPITTRPSSPRGMIPMIPMISITKPGGAQEMMNGTTTSDQHAATHIKYFDATPQPGSTGKDDSSALLNNNTTPPHPSSNNYVDSLHPSSIELVIECNEQPTLSTASASSSSSSTSSSTSSSSTTTSTSNLPPSVTIEPPTPTPISMFKITEHGPPAPASPLHQRSNNITPPPSASSPRESGVTASIQPIAHASSVPPTPLSTAASASATSTKRLLGITPKLFISPPSPLNEPNSASIMERPSISRTGSLPVIGQGEPSPRPHHRPQSSISFLGDSPLLTPSIAGDGKGTVRSRKGAQQGGVSFQNQQNPLDDFNEEDHLPPLKHQFAPPKQRLFIHPQSKVKSVWSVFLIIFITYSLFEVPLSVGFGYNAGTTLKAISYLIDCFFMIDVCLNFFTGFIDEQLELVHDPKQIAHMYIRGWFAADAIGSIPFDLISAASGTGANGTKVFFVFRALKIPRLFRMVKLTQLLDVRSHRYLREVIRMVKLVLIMVVIGHWIACGFMLTARSESSDIRTWAAPVLDSDLGTQYVFSLYWSLTVLSTVGFGDIVPLTQTEMIYTCIVMLMGAILYAVVVGNVMLVLANLNAPSQRHTEEIMKLVMYMRYRKFPPNLMKKVIDFTEAEWKRMRGYNEREVMAHLPESLQTEIARHLHAKMLTNVSFFKNSHSGFINSVVLAFHTAMFLPNTIMIRRNQPGDKMFFVAKGSIELIDRGQVYAVLQEGSYVGESALLDGLYRVTARTATYCELCVLYRSDFDRIVRNYPEFVDIVSAQAEQTTIMASKKDKLKALFS